MEVRTCFLDAYTHALETAQPRYLFLQDPAYARMKSADGNPVETLLFESGGHVLASALVVYYRYHRFFWMAHCVYGPVWHPEGLAQLDRDPQIAEALLAALKAHVLASPRVRGLRLTPPWPNRIYKDCEPMDDSPGPRFHAILQAQGFVRQNREWYEDSQMPARFLYAKALPPLPEGLGDPLETGPLAQSLAPTLRNRMRKAARDGIQVEFLKPDEIERFDRLLERTYARMDTLSYVRPDLHRAYACFFGPRCLFPMAVLHLPQALAAVDQQVAEIEQAKQQLEADYAGRAHNDRYHRLMAEQAEALQRLETQRESLRSIQAEAGDSVDLNGGLFLQSGSEMVYLLGAGEARYFALGGAAAMHASLLRIAVEKGCQVYNLFGCSGDFSPGAPDAGVMRFKRTFRGQMEEFVGTYVYRKSPWQW